MNDIDSLQRKFGKLLVKNGRESALVTYYMTLHHRENLKRVMGDCADQLTDEMKKAIRNMIIHCIDSTTSDLLCALDNYEEYMDSLKIMVDGEDILDGNMQVMLHGGEVSWMEEYGNVDHITEDHYLDE